MISDGMNDFFCSWGFATGSLPFYLESDGLSFSRGSLLISSSFFLSLNMVVLESMLSSLPIYSGCLLRTCSMNRLSSSNFLPHSWFGQINTISNRLSNIYSIYQLR